MSTPIPLTLQEVLSTIRAIPSEPDIIHNACFEHSHPDLPRLTPESTGRELAAHIILQHNSPGRDASTFISALLQAAAIVMAVSCGPGKERTMLEASQEYLKDLFMRERFTHFRIMSSDNPARAEEMLLGLIQQLGPQGPAGGSQ